MRAISAGLLAILRLGKGKVAKDLQVEEEKLDAVSPSRLKQSYVHQLGAKEQARKRRERKQAKNLVNKSNGGWR